MRTVHRLASLSDEDLAEIYAWPSGPSLRLNMLIGPSANSSGIDGTSHSLTSSEDRRLLRLIREDADAVVVGAASVRAEGWFLPPHGTLVVLSETGNLPWDTCPDFQRVVVCNDIKELHQWLQDHPGRHLCEGGLTTARLIGEAEPFTQVALTSHIDAESALAHVTIRPEQFALEFAANIKPETTGPTEAFFLWRRAAALKDK